MGIHYLIILFLLLVSPARADVTDGLVGWWKFDEGSGTTVVDSTGRGNTGSLVGSPAWVAGKRNFAVNFDGIDDYVDIAENGSNLTFSTTFSLVLWVKVDALNTSNRYILSRIKAPGGDNAYAIIWEYSDNNVQFYLSGSAVGYPAANTNIGISDTSTWHHIVYTYDGSTFKGYLDSVSAFTPVTVAFSISTTIGNLLLGTYDGSAHRLVGSLDDLRIYNRALTQTEINAIYLAGTPHVSVKGGGRISGMKVK